MLWNNFTVPKCFLVLFFCQSYFTPHAPSNTDLLSVPTVFAFSRIQVSGIIHYVVFSFWLSPLSTMLERYIHIVCLSSLLLFLAGWCSLAQIHQKVLVHSPVDGHLIVTSLELWGTKLLETYENMWTCVSFLLSKRLVERLLGIRLVYIYLFIRNCQTVYQSGFTILHPHQEWVRIQPKTYRVLAVSTHLC